MVARLAHNQKVVGSSPTPATSLNVMEVPVATKRLGEDRNVKCEITDSSVSTPQLPLCSLKSFFEIIFKNVLTIT